MQELSGGHWLSVSRGPPEDIVDAWGDFTDSLAARRLSDAQMQVRLPCYPVGCTGTLAWQSNSVMQ